MSTPEERPAAVLVAVQLEGVTDVEHRSDLEELRRLVTTLGLEVVATISQRRPRLAPGAVLGEGKLKELAALTGGSGVIPTGATVKKDKARLKREAVDPESESESESGPESDSDPDLDIASDASDAPKRKPTVVIVDHEISPSQASNLEKATDAQVLDRTGVIVEIFHRHARSREAKLQVEIARLAYVAPRLRASGAGGDRVRGGVGGKGAGESAVELDRRKIRDRIAELKEELVHVQRDQSHRRTSRREQRRVALVGYTNAGKSSLMRALTGSEVLVADKLFATLDTTVRALHPESRPRVLVSDTVGFIKKLPHDLVASFRSTLDEAHEASLLLFVVDGSDPTHEAQLEVTRTVLREIGADQAPSLLLLNKVDRVDAQGRAILRAQHPNAILLCAKEPNDVAKLRAEIISFFDRDMVDAELTVPYGKEGLVSEVYENARVVTEEWDESGAKMTIRAHPTDLARLRTLVVK